MSEDKPVPPPQEPSPSQQAAPAKPPPVGSTPFDERVVFEDRPVEPTPTFMDGCLKVIGVLIIGAFVLGGLIFATCFLSMRR